MHLNIVNGLEEYVHINMIPSYWDGPGVIGCALKTIKPHSKLFLMARRFSGRLSGRLPSFGEVKRVGSNSSGGALTGGPASPTAGGRPASQTFGIPPVVTSPARSSSVSMGKPSGSTTFESDPRLPSSPSASGGHGRSASDVYGKGDWGSVISDEDDGEKGETF